MLFPAKKTPFHLGFFYLRKTYGKWRLYMPSLIFVQTPPKGKRKSYVVQKHLWISSPGGQSCVSLNIFLGFINWIQICFFKKIFLGFIQWIRTVVIFRPPQQTQPGCFGSRKAKEWARGEGRGLFKLFRLAILSSGCNWLGSWPMTCWPFAGGSSWIFVAPDVPNTRRRTQKNIQSYKLLQ